MTAAYFAPLVGLPAVITEPGAYLTRCGEPVQIKATSRRHDFGCAGLYPEGQAEHWHKSGRLFASRESLNDIVRRA